MFADRCFIYPDNSFCRYHSLAPMYYRGAQAAIVVYDITNQVILHGNTNLFALVE